ncbi:glycosyl transferase, family II [Desulfosarcina variabilis str. Montpellier]|uniref:glycosyltransferase family 2 protein n=1 Tax=Desulfosarcina variabilis TaxID=2300 RepID=UPI003AFA09FD
MKTIQPPLVSVIMPTFNRAWSLKKAIDSVLSQEYANLETIVVDDGSTDDTPALLSSYGTRIRVIRQANQGVSAARNAGIRAAQGELITLLDSDDAWLPGKVQAQVDFFDAHPENLICQTEEIWIRHGRRVNPKRHHKKHRGMIFERCLPLCLISPSAVMMRRRLLDEVGLFDEQLPACEDYDLWLRITFKYPVALIDEPLIVKHGGHADQLSAMPQLDRYRIQAIVKILRQGVLSADQTAAALDVLTRKCAIYATGCRKRGRLGEAAYFDRLPDDWSSQSIVPVCD